MINGEIKLLACGLVVGLSVSGTAFAENDIYLNQGVFTATFPIVQDGGHLHVKPESRMAEITQRAIPETTGQITHQRPVAEGGVKLINTGNPAE